MAFLSSPLPRSQSVLDTNLYSAEQVRELDRRSIHDCGIAGISLMKRAGEALFELILEQWEDAGHLSIFCGAGNNGGDGYIVAGLAARKNIAVLLVEVAGDKLKGDAALARDFALQQGVVPTAYDQWLSNPELAETSVIVDALLGTGFLGDLRAPYIELISCINKSGLPVVAADIPSGLEANTGFVGSDAVCADCTLTFIGNKFGLFTGNGRAQCGEIYIADLNVPAEVYADIAPLAQLLDLDEELQSLPLRAADAHKGSHGHVLIVGGDSGFAGAPLMAAEAAAHMGAGLVSVATRPEHCAAFISRCPELMVFDATSAKFDQYLAKVDVIVIGPGLGLNAWGQRLLQKVLAAQKPMLLDADALNLIASGQFANMALTAQSVITPHLGEAARLLQVSTGEIGRDRLSAVDKLANKYQCTALLKGSGTLIKNGGVKSESVTALCPYGNPGMGSGGMGDVLSGIIGGLMAQGLSAELAARLGACLHASAADVLADMEGARGLLATDLIDTARTLLNGMD